MKKEVKEYKNSIDGELKYTFKEQCSECNNIARYLVFFKDGYGFFCYEHYNKYFKNKKSGSIYYQQINAFEVIYEKEDYNDIFEF